MKNRNSFKNHKKIFLKSIVFTLMVIIIWYYLFWETFKNFPEGEEVMSAVVAGFLVFSALLPSFTVSRLSQQYDELKSAVIDRDIKLFKRIYQRIH